MHTHIKRILGFAADEALLITAMVGSAGTFAAVAVPWDTVMSSSTTKAITYLTNMEQANSKFYDVYEKWPYQMTNGKATNNAAALVTKNALTYPYNHMKKYTPLLEDAVFDVTSKGIELRHSFGEGGRILQRPSQSRRYRMEVVFENIPYSIAKKMDQEIDGKEDPDKGRVKLRFNDGQVDVIFQSNQT